MIVNRHYDFDEIPEVQKPGVYGIHNLSNDKYYIGSTTNLYHRFSLHFRCMIDGEGINRKMMKDFYKFEHIDHFELIIFEEFNDYEITNHELRKREGQYIKKYNAINHGYNTEMPNSGVIPDNQLLKAKDYMGQKRKNQLVLYLPKPIIEEIKAKAKKMMITPTKYITQLIEREMQDNP